jgi:hypothetical protein
MDDKKQTQKRSKKVKASSGTVILPKDGLHKMFQNMTSEQLFKFLDKLPTNVPQIKK